MRYTKENVINGLDLTVSLLDVSILVIFTSSFAKQTAFTGSCVSTLKLLATSSTPVDSVFNIAAKI
jgi:hypothetical protein